MNFNRFTTIPPSKILIIQPTASTCCRRGERKEREREKTHLHSSSNGFDVRPQNPDRFVNCLRLPELRGSRHTHSARSGGLICGDHCTDPDQIRCQSTKLPSFPLVVAVWERRAATDQLKDSGAKRWKPRSAELQAWSKGMRPGLGEVAELIGLAARLWTEKNPGTRYLQVKPGLPRNKVKSHPSPLSLPLCRRPSTSAETAESDANEIISLALGGRTVCCYNVGGGGGGGGLTIWLFLSECIFIGLSRVAVIGMNACLHMPVSVYDPTAMSTASVLMYHSWF